MQEEFGGCLHFEIPQVIGGYYDRYKDHLVNVDSGRSALQYILETFNYKRIWLPVYNCPLVGQRINEVSDIEICWYNIRPDFLPDIDMFEFDYGDCLLWVNYCGVMTQSAILTLLALQKESPVKIIFDNIPAYFSLPQMEAINIYSCRKFIGVPDGGHIIGNAVNPVQLPTYVTAENYVYLMRAIETGSNSAYEGYTESEKRFSQSVVAYGMPELTKVLLSGVDYDRLIIKRKNNFLVLHDVLGDRNRLSLDISTTTPSVYPYLCSDINLRDRLLENKIYVSRFWKHVLSNELANDFEKDLAEYLIPLPIDQRYDVDDMKYMAMKVLELEDVSK